MNQKGLAKDFWIDSAATSTEEIGNDIYPPMRSALEQKEIPIGDHRAKQLRRENYEEFDYFVGMDAENIYYMKKILGDDPEQKIYGLMEFTDHPEAFIDDPWYTRRFDFCVEQIQKGCIGFLDYLNKENRKKLL